MPLLIACRLNESKAKQKLESSVQKKKRKEKSKQKGDDIAAFYEQHRES